jgi:hypothetical protein
MRLSSLFCIALLAAACSAPEHSEKEVPHQPDTIIVTPSKADHEMDKDTNEYVEEEYVDFFVTIADTGHSFEAMTKTMMHLTQSFGAVEMEHPINQYIPERDSLMVPPDSDDEMWRGAYMLRRSADETMTVEYLDMYDTAAPPGTMAVVTGIWSERSQADSVLRAHRSGSPVPRLIPARLYQGCMH